MGPPVCLWWAPFHAAFCGWQCKPCNQVLEADGGHTPPEKAWDAGLRGKDYSTFETLWWWHSLHSHREIMVKICRCLSSCLSFANQQHQAFWGSYRGKQERLPYKCNHISWTTELHWPYLVPLHMFCVEMFGLIFEVCALKGLDGSDMEKEGDQSRNEELLFITQKKGWNWGAGWIRQSWSLSLVLKSSLCELVMVYESKFGQLKHKQ